jgi:predicted metal-dependent enzyme (double-stranded beta helix superfamily)
MHWTLLCRRAMYRQVGLGGTRVAGDSSGFDLEEFVDECLRAVRDSTAPSALHEVVARAVREPARIMRALGEPCRAEIQKLYHSSDLTIINVIWAPRMTVMPHDHRMAAVIGIYTGREDNIFWRRRGGVDGSQVEAAGARALMTTEAALLGRNIIHSVTNPISRFTGALHVYAGDFFNTARSEWDPESLLQRPYNVQKALRLFEDENARLLQSDFAPRPTADDA